MRVDRRDAHVELVADLGLGLAEPDRDGDLALAVAQPVELLAGFALALADAGVGDVAISHAVAETVSARPTLPVRSGVDRCARRGRMRRAR